jgi:hypothetical protein
MKRQYVAKPQRKICLKRYDLLLDDDDDDNDDDDDDDDNDDTFSMGNNITCTINCNYRTAATQFTLETCFIYEL